MINYPDSSVRCAISAHACMSVPFAELTTLRAELAAAFPETLSSSVLKQSDEQGLVALAALREAITQGRLSPDELRAWGVVAAPRALGRRRIAEGLAKFSQQGAWSTSPHLIPYLSLHSLPGLLSQAISSHGPNLGVGGLPGSEGEALLVAVTLLHGERLPGVFVVFSGWERESLTQEPGDICQSAILGLRAKASDAEGHVEIELGRNGNLDPFTLESLIQNLRHQSPARWKLPGAICTMSLEQSQMEAAA